MMIKVLKLGGLLQSARNITKTFSGTYKYSKLIIDYSRFPQLNESEIEETFVRGSGPGGQAVNKTSNCVTLRHIPTNIIIKCHTHRLASRNRIEARRLLLQKLDNLINKENSIESQIKANADRKSAERKRRQQKLYDLKKNWKDREQSEANEPGKIKK